MTIGEEYGKLVVFVEHEESCVAWWSEEQSNGLVEFVDGFLEEYMCAHVEEEVTTPRKIHIDPIGVIH